MTNKDIQIALKGLGMYNGIIDGILGSKSIRAIMAFQSINNLTVDGIVGSNTLAKLFIEPFGDRDSDIVIDSNISEFPHQKNVESFYGKVGENQTLIELPYSMVLAWDTSKSIRRFSCHKLVSDRMLAIFEHTLEEYGKERIHELGLNIFGGCLNVRKMRGGSGYSMHSWGIAVDLDPSNNQLKWDSGRAKFAKSEYDIFWDIVENQGAISLGRERNFDWMHFQFARL